MKYTEISVFGVYVAPFVPMMLIAWLLTLPLRRLSHRVGIARYVWHPALFNTSVYLIVLSLLVLVIGWRSLW
jgi:protein AaeX